MSRCQEREAGGGKWAKPTDRRDQRETTCLTLQREPAIARLVIIDRQTPRTIRSLRALLKHDGFTEAEIDAVDAFFAGSGDTAENNIVEGIRRETLTAMQLRAAPILDAIQDKIFRLPLDSQIAVLGPPGTGKTTTLVKRLRQKVDFAYLDPAAEQSMVIGTDAAGLSHADSWVMFSPTELLRQYVKEAFGKAGVPVHDERLRTWDDYRREIGRRALRVLRDGTGTGLVIQSDDAMLGTDTLRDQIGWFEAFDTYQRADFVHQLVVEADRLSNAADPAAALLGRQVTDIITRASERPLQLVGELASLADRLRAAAASEREATRAALRQPLRDYARDDFLIELERFVEVLASDDVEEAEAEEEEADGDDDDAGDAGATSRGRALVQDVFLRAMRARAIAQASGRSPAARSRAGRLLGWLRDRGLALPDLRRTGDVLLVQRAALRLSRAPSDFLAKLPLRYRRFRRAMRDNGDWYGDGRYPARNAHAAEIDLILLAMLRTAQEMEADRLLLPRLGDRIPPVLTTIRQLRRNQVLVDEATDFSPVQLACMRALASTRTDSFFLSGDFNQRLTLWGSRTDDELRWVSPGIEFHYIHISYRQTRKLAAFATALGRSNGYEVEERAPEHIDNEGFAPVLGRSLDTVPTQVAWLAVRIAEINRLTDGKLPTIAILICDRDAMDPLADALSEALAEISLRAVACPRGLVKGQDGDIRIFEVEHIKGLEFEAVFFLDIDRLRVREPTLFDRYIYVGATRAATFLGLSCGEAALPPQLASLQDAFVDHW